MGQEAEKASKWSEARSDYAAASDYRDAPARAASVIKVINALQDNFVSARWHAQEGDWAAALRAVQAVHAIDPHYGDVSSLGAEANLHVYQEALQGAVAMRPKLNHRACTTGRRDLGLAGGSDQLEQRTELAFIRRYRI